MNTMVSPCSPGCVIVPLLSAKQRPKPQGQLNGNRKVARGEYGRIDVTQRLNAYFMKKNYKKQNSPNQLENKKMAGKYRAAAFTVLTRVGQGIIYTSNAFLSVTRSKRTVKDCMTIPKNVNEKRLVTNYLRWLERLLPQSP